MTLTNFRKKHNKLIGILGAVSVIAINLGTASTWRYNSQIKQSYNQLVESAQTKEEKAKYMQMELSDTDLNSNLPLLAFDAACIAGMGAYALDRMFVKK